MKTGDLIRVIRPLPKRNIMYTPWVQELSISGIPVPLVEFNGKGGFNQVYYNGTKRYVSDDLMEVVYETRQV
jgi:hypothetical protein